MKLAILFIIMNCLVGSDRLLAMAGSTMGVELSERRVGVRMYHEQLRYKESMNNDDEVGRIVKRFATYADLHFGNESLESRDKGRTVRNKIPEKFQGNRQAYLFVQDLMDIKIQDRKNNYPFKSEKIVWDKCLSSALNRAGPVYTLKEQLLMMQRFSKVSEACALYSSVEIALEDLNAKRVAEHNEAMKVSKKKHKEEKIGKTHDDGESLTYQHNYSDRDKALATPDFDMFVVGALRILKTKNGVYLMTDVHYNRAVMYMSGLRRLCLATKDIHVTESPYSMTQTACRAFHKVAVKNCNFVGEVAKAAKQLCFLGLEESHIIGHTLKNYKKAIDKDRAEQATVMAEAFRIMTKDRITATNLIGIYTCLPHPDPCLSEMFNKIEGVKDPNDVDENMTRRLEGVMRRNMYASLRKSGNDVRVKSNSIGGQKLVDITNDATQQTGKAKGFASSVWGQTTFEVVRGVTGPSQMDIPIASKASSAGILMTTSEEQEAKAYFAGYGDSIPMKLMGPSTVNDASTLLKGVSRMDFAKALKRFEKVITMHEKFEAHYPDMSIDEIPSKALEDFLKSHPYAQYIVNTEGKFGEVHKAVTRLFYMAEQQLKTLTQRTERLAKQVTRQQEGVSIVKGFLGRREDLQRSIYALKGKGGRHRGVAISFDMSEFSKKFSNVLVRMFGGILAEVTGEDFLRRIDLFFRASKVMYSNRGFYDDLRGARGGFEGFLNFIWSSIHASIMEVALETSGVQGDLLTFSDDGLLIFYPISTLTDIEITKLVSKIQLTFDMLGLKFHLGKTLVSDHMWEYLGDFCYNNRLIPMWVKELCKLGNLDVSRGYTPMYDKIKAIDAQGGAMVISSGDPITAYVGKRYECHRMLRKYLKGTKPILEEVLLSIPPSCGGLRIQSPFEDTAYLTISRDAEVFADFVMLDRLDRGLYAKVTSSILMRSRKVRENCVGYKATIGNTSIFKTTIPDTSGSRHLNNLIDLIKARSSFKVPKDPLDCHTARDIFDILCKAECVDLDAVGQLINSIPGMSEYQTFLGVVKGGGALKLVRRKELSKAQAGDTKSLKAAINFWSSVILGPAPAANRDFLERMYESSYPFFSVKRMRPSARICLERTDDPLVACIEVKFNGTSAPNIYDAPYKEPILRSPSDPTTLNWHAEATGDTEQRDIRKFLTTVSRVVSQYPAAEDTIRGLCSIFGCTPPQTLAGRVRGINRDRKAVKRNYDARLILPRYHMYHVSSRNINRLALYVARDITADRTTYQTACESLAYFIHVVQFPLGEEQNTLNVMHYFKTDDSLYSAMFLPPVMKDTDRTEKMVNVTQLSSRLAKEYIAAAEEDKAYLDHLSMIYSARDLEEGDINEDTEMLTSGFIAMIERYLTSVYGQSRRNILSEVEMPRMAVLRTYVLRRALAGAAAAVLEPRVRVEVSVCLNNYRIDSNLNLLLSNNHFKEYLSKIEELYALLPGELTSMTPMVDMHEVRLHRRTYLDIFVSVFYDSTYMSNKSITVFFSKSFKSNEFSNDHKVAYRKVFRETVRALFSSFASVKWDKRQIAIKFPSIANMDIDEQIDVLKVLYNVIRSSDHRGDPYNPKSSIIELNKFYTLVALMCRETQRVDHSVTKDYYSRMYKDWIPSSEEQARILSIVPIHGTDHAKNVTRKLSNGVVRRAAWLAYRFQKQKVLPVAVKGNLTANVQEIKALQTSFNETIIRAVRGKVKSYHYGIGKTLGREFISIARNQARIAGLQTNRDCVMGRNILDNNPRRDVEDLLINHLEILKHGAGLVGYKVADEDDGPLMDRITRENGFEGYAGIPRVGIIARNYNDVKYSMFDISCNNLPKALSTYIHLCSGSESSASIIKDDEMRLVELDIAEQDDVSDNTGDLDQIDEGDEGECLDESASGESEEEVDIQEDEVALADVRWGDDYMSSGDEDDVDDEGMEQVDEGVAEDRYRVVGVTSKAECVFDDTGEPNVMSNISDVLADLVDNMTFANSVRETDTLLSSLTSSTHRSAMYRTTAYNITRQSNIFSPGRQVNEDSTSLQAATELAQESDSPHHLVSAYILLLCYLRDTRDKVGMRGTITEVYLSIREDKTRILADISMAMRWLRSSDITAGANIRMNAIRKLKKYFSKLTSNFNTSPPLSTTTMAFRSARDARTLAVRDVAAGSLTSLLFYVEDVDEEEFEINDEEISENDDISDDDLSL